MSTTTNDEQLAEIRRRIDRLQAFAQAGPAGNSPRIRRHLDALRREEASIVASAPEAPNQVDEKVRQLKTRLAVAENSLVADISDDWTTYARAVEEELRSWDTYLERVQTTAATRDETAREQAEAAIADVRARRIAVHDRLTQARRNVDGAWHEQRIHVSAARDELERKADELPAKVK